MNVLNNLATNDNVTSNIINIKNYIKKFFLLFGFVKSESGNLFFYALRCMCAIVFILGYFYYNEDFSLIKLVSFIIIWIAVIIYLKDLYESN